MEDVETLLQTIQHKEATQETFLALYLLLHRQPEQVMDAFNNRHPEECRAILTACREVPHLGTLLLVHWLTHVDLIASRNLRVYLCSVVAEAAHNQRNHWRERATALAAPAAAAAENIIEWYAAQQELAEVQERYQASEATITETNTLRARKQEMEAAIAQSSTGDIAHLEEEIRRLKNQFQKAVNLAQTQAKQLEQEVSQFAEDYTQARQEIVHKRRTIQNQWESQITLLATYASSLKQEGELNPSLAQERDQMLQQLGDPAERCRKLRTIFEELDQFEELVGKAFEDKLRTLIRNVENELRKGSRDAPIVSTVVGNKEVI
ncbi:MAG: hypothetical protein HC884_15320 [Chloroflexaceae bacterium]|nr:hypothetical protein [Chloroflexaceae bacterium]